MTSVEFWTIIATGGGIILACIGAAWVIWKEVRSFEVQLAEDRRQLGYRIDQQAKRIDQQAKRIDEQNKRTDRLYEMFIDLVKEGRK